MTIRDKLLAAARPRLARHGIALGKTPVLGRLDHALMRVFEAYNIDCVLDVGAHSGEFACFLRQVCGWKGPICSFEPVHSNFLEMTRAMEHDRAWRGVETALGANHGAAIMRHFPSKSNFDSLRPTSEFGRHLFPVLASEFCEEHVTVQRLDTVIDDALDLFPGDRALLKIDAQGSDLEVLRGSTNCLPRVASLQVELSARAIYEGVSTLGTAIDEVMAYGFDPVGFFPVFREQGLRVVEFDGLFVRPQ